MRVTVKAVTLLTTAALAVTPLRGQHHAPTYAGALPDVGLDMAIDDNNDAVPDNSATSIGTVQSCVQAHPGETVTIDSFVRGIPAGTDFGGFRYVMELASTLSLGGS